MRAIRTGIVPALLLVLTILLIARADTVLDRLRNRARSAANPQAADSGRSIVIDGSERSYVLHLPPAFFTTAAKLPLVLFFHGGKSKAERMDWLTGFNAVADRNGFIIAYPKGVDERWNDGRGSSIATADDVGFVRALIDALVRDERVDARRVFATGISNGAILLHLLACELPDRIAAIASVAGTIPANVAAAHPGARGVPVLMIHGTKDPLILWSGGSINRPGQIPGAMLSAEDSIKFWAKRNGYGEEPRDERMPDAAQDGTTTIRHEYGPRAILYEVVDGGHTWSGGKQYAPEMIIGKTSRDFDAGAVIWDFFSKTVS